MANYSALKPDETSRQANRKVWLVTVVVAAVVVLIAVLSWVNIHLH